MNRTSVTKSGGGMSAAVVWFCGLGLLLTCGCSIQQRPHADARDCVVAAYGCFVWSEQNPEAFRKTFINDLDLRRDFPDREPLAGWYDDTQERFDRQLRSMADEGLDVLIIDWYPAHVTKSYDATLNHGTAFFLASKLRTPPRFCLTLINHDPFNMKTDAEWITTFEQWKVAFQDPRYWKIDGKPVLLIHSSWHLHRDEGGTEGAARRITWLREQAAKAGLPGLMIGGGSPKTGKREWFDRDLKRIGYDFMTAYNQPGWEAYKDRLGKDHDFLLPYRSLVEAHTRIWEEYPTATDVPFVPFLTIQWDPRPWWGASSAHSVRYDWPTDEEWRGFCRQAKELVDRSAGYRIPTNQGEGQKVVVICAWNELAEGSILAPTKGRGNQYMRIVREVFGERQMR